MRRLLGSALLILTGCSNLFGVGTSGQVGLSFSNLVDVDSKYGHYAAWGVGPGGATLLGRFLMAGGMVTELDGRAKTSWAPATGATEIWVTQESAQGGAPGRQIFLLGPISGGAASLAAPVSAADFAAARGTYVLDNPAFLNKTTAPATKGQGWEKLWNGIWFERLERDASGSITARKAGLEIPPLPLGWAYAAWVILPNGIPLRSGKFRNADENDDWSGYTGLNSVSLPTNFPGPPMPGEDFNTKLPPGALPADVPETTMASATASNLPDLAGARVIVSVENAALANEDPYPGPIRVFEATVPSPTYQNMMEWLTNVAASRIPSGRATVQ